MNLYKFYIPTLKYIIKNLIIEENEKKKKKNLDVNGCIEEKMREAVILINK